MFNDPPIAFREFAMAENLPLATIHAAVLEFLRGRMDAAIFGAQAVNAYVETPRMTQDVDVLSIHAEVFSTELSEHLHHQFHIAVRVRSVAGGSGYRIYQLRTPANRHLVNVRQTAVLPTCQRIEEILVVIPVELIAMKVVSMAGRRGTPKGLTDEADLLRLLLTFPELKSATGSVSDSLHQQNAPDNALQIWQDLVARDIRPESGEEY